MDTLARYVTGKGLPAGASFSRASTAYYRNKAGVWVQAAIDELRDKHYTLSGIRTTRLEQFRTNYLLNSGSPATQTRTLAAGTYTCWMEGSGSVVLSGGATGTVTAGWSFGRYVQFTLASTQSVTFTVSGSVTLFQCEGDFAGQPTSYIPTTSAAASRQPDFLSIPMSSRVQPLTVFIQAVESSASGANYSRWFEIGNPVTAAPRFIAMQGSNPVDVVTRHDNLSTFTTTPDQNIKNTSTIFEPTDQFEIRAFLNADGSHGVASSLNGAAEQAPATAAIVVPAATWSTPTSLSVCNTNDVDPLVEQNVGLVGIVVVSGVQTQATMRSVMRTPTYFGFTTAGAGDVGNADGFFYGTKGLNATCPVLTRPRLVELSALVRVGSGSPTVRLALYKPDPRGYFDPAGYNGKLVAQGTAKVSIANVWNTHAWVGHLTPEEITPNPCYLEPGQIYWVVVGHEGAVQQKADTVANGIAGIDFREANNAGFPDPSSLSDLTSLPNVRAGVLDASLAFVAGDRVKETTTTTGTGDITLNGASSGMRPFSDIAEDQWQEGYTIAGSTEWEIGIGTWTTGGVLKRTKVLASSNGGALVNFSAGTKDVSNDLPAALALSPASSCLVMNEYLPPGTGVYLPGLEIVSGGDFEVDVDARLVV